MNLCWEFSCEYGARCRSLPVVLRNFRPLAEASFCLCENYPLTSKLDAGASRRQVQAQSMQGSVAGDIGWVCCLWYSPSIFFWGEGWYGDEWWKTKGDKNSRCTHTWIETWTKGSGLKAFYFCYEIVMKVIKVYVLAKYITVLIDSRALQYLNCNLPPWKAHVFKVLQIFP